MKTVVQINVCCNGSTGRIMCSLHDMLVRNGDRAYCAYGRGSAPDCGDYIRIGNDLDIYKHVALTRIFDKHGFGSKRATESLINNLEQIKPDLVHLHNIHGYYLNVELLFDYLKKSGVPVVWTLHDCWAFTGHCAYFDFVGCENWKVGCVNCPEKKCYPTSLLKDNSEWNYKKKEQLFTLLNNMTIVTPSQWLLELVQQSFLKNYHVKVINNGVDLGRFKPIESEFRRKNHIDGAFLVLGVASVWDRRKGLDYFIRLADSLDDSFKIALVGVTAKQKRLLPKNIIAIERTDSVTELAKIYTAADVFVNPTLEDNFPTTNLEALACGTPVITFDTGGSAESIDETCGIVVKKGNFEELLDAIKYVKRTNLKGESCIIRSKKYDAQNSFLKYTQLYNQIIKDLNIV